MQQLRHMCRSRKAGRNIRWEKFFKDAAAVGSFGEGLRVDGGWDGR